MKKATNTIVAKTFQFFNRFVPVIENRSDGTYLYGVDDLLPNNNLRYINDCGVAKRCVRKKARYIQGDGFTNSELSKQPVNKKQTADQLLRTISSFAAYNEGFALQVRRDTTAKIVEVKSIPFQCVRKRINGDLTYNPKKGQHGYRVDNINKVETTIHPEFRAVITAKEYAELMRAYKSQPEILYVYEETADNPHYPVPDYNAGIEDIQTCAEISKMDLELSENGFMPSGVLTTHVIDNANEDDKGKTAYKYFVEELDNFTGKKKNEHGKSGRFKLLHIQVGDLAQAPKLEKYDAKAVLEGTNEKRDVIAREVCRLIGVHPILVGFSDAAILGNQQALSNVITDFNAYLNPIQRMISETFATLYPGNDWTIKQHNPIIYIPDQVWDKLTDDEKREMIGFDPIEKTTPSREQKILDTLNSLSPLLSAEIVKRLPDAELFKLIGMEVEADEPEQTDPNKPETDIHTNGQNGKLKIPDDGSNN